MNLPPSAADDRLSNPDTGQAITRCRTLNKHQIVCTVRDGYSFWGADVQKTERRES
jgi:hypothetical protein